MSQSAGVTLQGLARSALVVAGLLLLAVGIGNTLAGQFKVAQYNHVLRTTAAAPRPDSSVLFPKATEAEERREIARTKLDFYERLLMVGQWLSAVGFALVAAGVLRLRTRGPGAAPGSPVPN